MLTYEYECARCAYRFEAEQKISEAPLTKCVREGCTGNVRRLIPTSTSFVLKGSGWYKDGYR